MTSCQDLIKELIVFFLARISGAALVDRLVPYGSFSSCTLDTLDVTIHVTVARSIFHVWTVILSRRLVSSANVHATLPNCCHNLQTDTAYRPFCRLRYSTLLTRNITV